MTSAVANGADGLLAELRSLCARLPVPQPSWHPYVPQIAASRDDFEQALALAAERPAALECLHGLIDGADEPSLDPNAPASITAAWQRLEAVPRPGGQHPYLDEILPALEAIRLLLAALGHTDGR